MSQSNAEFDPEKIQPKRIGTKDPSPLAAPTLAYEPRSHTYNDTWFWRSLATTTIRLLQRKGVIGGIICVPFTKFCIKYGRDIQLSEATAQHFVQEKTSIPVPKVYSAFIKRGVHYIVMEKIDGEQIGQGWAERPGEKRKSLLQQLKGYVDDLHNIPNSNPGSVAGAYMQPLWEPRTYKGNLGFGPFANEHDFNMFLRYGFQYTDPVLGGNSIMTEEEKSEIRRLIQLQDE